MVHTYVSGYTSSQGRGIYLYDFNPHDGTLSHQRLVAETTAPSYIVLHPDQQCLYALNEVDEFQGQSSGAVSCFARGSDGTLKLVNQQPSGGAEPCHASLSHDKHHLLVANYGGGSVAVLPIVSNGALDPTVFVSHHQGATGHVPSRQEKPHAHAIDVVDRDWVIALDLGTDQAVVYQSAPQSNQVLKQTTAYAFPNGTGPRHLAIWGDYVYVVGELSNEVFVLALDRQHGRLCEIERVQTLPGSFEGENLGAEIAVAGRFLYVSLRGLDAIAIYAIDAATGRLRFVGHQPCGGKHPRHFVIHPSGHFMLVANKDSNNIVVFAVDEVSGLLEPRQEIQHPEPTCVQFWT